RPTPRDPPRAGDRPGVRRGRRGVPRGAAGATVPGHVRPADRRAQDPGPDRQGRQPGPVPGDHRERPGGAGQAGDQPVGRGRQVGRGEGAAAGAGGDRAVLRRGGARVRDSAEADGTEQPGLPRRACAAEPAAGGRPPGGREYGKVVSDKAVSPTDPTVEWVTPGHPLFEAVRTDTLARVEDHLRRGPCSSTCTGSGPPCWTCSPRRSRTGGGTRCTAGSS